MDKLSIITHNTSKDKANTFQCLGYLVEEVGEISRTLLEDSGLKRKKNKETVLDETVDAIICSLSLYVKLGGAFDEDFQKRMDKKLAKWTKNLSCKERKRR